MDRFSASVTHSRNSVHPYPRSFRKGRVQLEAQRRFLCHGLRLHRACTPPLVLQTAPEGASRALPHSLQDGQGAGLDGAGPTGVRTCAAERFLPVQPGGGGPRHSVAGEGGGCMQTEVMVDAAEQLEDLADRNHH